MISFKATEKVLQFLVDGLSYISTDARQILIIPEEKIFEPKHITRSEKMNFSEIKDDSSI